MDLEIKKWSGSTYIGAERNSLTQALFSHTTKKNLPFYLCQFFDQKRSEGRRQRRAKHQLQKVMPLNIYIFRIFSLLFSPCGQPREPFPVSPGTLALPLSACPPWCSMSWPPCCRRTFRPGSCPGSALLWWTPGPCCQTSTGEQ